MASDRTEGTLEHSSLSDEFKRPGATAGSATVDEILQDELGEMGKAQWLALLVGGLSFFAAGSTMFTANFTSAPSDPVLDPKAWVCNNNSQDDPQCHAVWNALSDATTLSTSASAQSAAELEGACSLHISQYSWIEPHAYVDTRFGLVCNRRWQLPFLQTMYFVGVLLGNGILGPVSDKYGRRRVLFLGALCTAIATAAAGAAPSYMLHLLLRILNGAACAGTMLAGYVLVMEFAGPSWRGAAGMLTQTFYIFGEFFLAAAAAICLSLRDNCDGCKGGGAGGWRALTFITVLPYLMLLAAWKLVPESPRWLLSKGRQAEAEASLQWVARHNKRRLTRRPCMSSTTHQQGPTAAHIPFLEPATASEAAGTAPLLGLTAPCTLPQSGEQELVRFGRRSDESDTAGSSAESADPYSSSITEDTCVVVVQSACIGKKDMAGFEAPNLAVEWDGHHKSIHLRPELEPSEAAALIEQESSLQERNILYRSTDAADARTALKHHGAEEPMQHQNPEMEGVEESLWSILKHRILTKYFVTVTYAMCSLSIAYFGVSLALGTLSGSLVANFAATAAAELPAYLIIAAVSGRVGRRPVVAGGALISGGACGLLGLLTLSSASGQVVLAMIGKFGCSSAWALIITYASELFPTTCRTAAVGAVSQAGDLGGILAPQLLLLGAKIRYERLAFLVMGVTSIMAAALVLLLPETLGMPQQDTAEDLLNELAERKRIAQMARRQGARPVLSRH